MTATKAAPPKALVGLHPAEYEHPLDRKALNALDKVPGLDTLLKMISKYGLEKVATVQHTGSGVRVAPDSYPELYTLLDSVCTTLNLPVRPECYLERSPMNAFAAGMDKPILILTTELVDELADDELVSIIGHEIAHMKSQHQLYRTLASELLPAVLSMTADMTFGISAALLEPLQWAMLYWWRMSEFTCDRAGLLACQDLDAAIRAEIKMAGLPARYYDKINVDAFIQQARDFQELDEDFLTRLVKFQFATGMTHPWSVLRAAELLKWVDSGEYQRVLNRETAFAAGIVVENGVQLCVSCRTQLQGSEQFCPVCGVALRTPDQQASSAGKRD